MKSRLHRRINSNPVSRTPGTSQRPRRATLVKSNSSRTLEQDSHRRAYVNENDKSKSRQANRNPIKTSLSTQNLLLKLKQSTGLTAPSTRRKIPLYLRRNVQKPSTSRLPRVKDTLRNDISRHLSNSRLPASTNVSGRHSRNCSVEVAESVQKSKNVSVLVEATVRNRVTKCAYRTKTGQVMGKPKPDNQDAYIITPSLNNTKGQYFFSVCDGHGVFGHFVSGFLKHYLPITLETLFPTVLTESSEQSLLSHTLKHTFEKVTNLLGQSNIDVHFSGSTCCSMVIRGELIMCANCGDSRAVLGSYTEGKWIATDLTKDQKPDSPGEQERIEANGGVVAPFVENGEASGPARVWVKDAGVPGLAMSRSFGDYVARSVGVISEPEITAYRLKQGDKFVILASDGIWEFISSEDAVKIVGGIYAKKRNVEECCEALTKLAIHRWNEEDQVVDDITLIIIFFK